MTSTPIARQVAEMHAQGAAGEQSAPALAFRQEQAELAAAGRPTGVLAPGFVLADAPLLDVHGEPTTLYGALGSRPAVLVLYRGASWCPYCNLALRTYRSELVPELDARGVALVAMSPQRPDGSLSTRDRHNLTYTVLSDPGSTLARALGVLTAPSDGARGAQLGLGLDLSEVNADGTHAVPMPTTVVLDADRRMRWIDVHPDYSTRSEPAEVLTAVDAAVARTGLGA